MEGFASRRSRAAIAFASSPLGALVPVLSAVVAVAVIGTCVQVAKAEGHIPEWLDTPPISLAGIHEPEVILYKVGFPLITVLFFLLELPFTTAVRAAIETAPRVIAHPEGSDADAEQDGQTREDVLRVLERASWVARIAFVCLGVQGVIPLQGWGSLAGFVHVMSANAFFLLSIYHGACVLWCLATPIAEAAKAALPIARAADPIGWWLRCLVLGAAFFPMAPAMLLHPGTQPVDEKAVRLELQAASVRADGESLRRALQQAEHEQQVETAGFSQWWMVGMLILYFALYSKDLWQLGTANKHRLKEGDKSCMAGLVTLLSSSDEKDE